jgi:ADP-ribosylglycohydrolase
LVIVRRQGAEESASIEWSGDSVALQFDGRSERAPRVVAPNGEYDDYAALAQVARELGPGAELVACGSCLHLGFSGALAQTTGRSAGYCGMAGYRQKYAVVRIDYACGEHRLAPGWPADQDRAWQARDALGMRSPWPTRSNAFRGCMIGLVAGDAPGYPVSVAVAEALVTAGTADVDALVREIAQRAVAGTTVPERDHASGVAMSAAPIGLVCWRDPIRGVELARASGRLMSHDDSTIEGAAAVALLVGLGMQKRTPSEMQRAVLRECGSRSAHLARVIQKVPDLLREDPAVALSREGLGEGRVAEEAVASALYCFWRSPEDYRKTVLTATNVDGGSDAIRGIAGGISGAFNGVSAIPEDWRTRVGNVNELLAIADRLLDRAADRGSA